MSNEPYYRKGKRKYIQWDSHYCLNCGTMLDIKESTTVMSNKVLYSFIAEFWQKPEHNCIVKYENYYCPKCKILINPLTQFSLEANERRIDRIQRKLQSWTNVKSIKKIWIDKNENVPDTSSG